MALFRLLNDSENNHKTNKKNTAFGSCILKLVDFVEMAKEIY